MERFQATGELSFVAPEIDFARIRAISFAYPKGDDWRRVDAFVEPALAAE